MEQCDLPDADDPWRTGFGACSLEVYQAPDVGKPDGSALDALYALARRVRKAQHEDELSDVESRIDDILSDQRLKIAGGDEDAADMATLNVAANRSREHDSCPPGHAEHVIIGRCPFLPIFAWATGW